MPTWRKVIQEKSGVKVTQVDVMGLFEKAEITYSVSAPRTSEIWPFKGLAEALKRFDVEVGVAEQRGHGR